MSTLRGHDEILLLSILALGEEAYGAIIMQHLSRLTGREWSIGAIYDPLHRMEKNGLVGSELTAPAPERGGRRKRVYHVTKTGREALRRHREIRDAIGHGFSRPLPDADAQ